MVWFILAILLFLFGGGLIIGGMLYARYAKAEIAAATEEEKRYGSGRLPDPDAGRLTYAVGAVLVGIGILFLLIASIYRQDVGEAAVIRTPGGTVHGIDITAGFSMKAPWNNVVKFDTRNQVITMAGGGDDHDGPAIATQTSDNATATIDVTVRYSIDPSAVGDIYAQYQSQDNLLARALLNDIRSTVREIPVQYKAAVLRQERVKVAADITTALQGSWDELGVQVDAVDLRDIRYPEQIEESLSAIQTAAAQVATAEQELQAARVEAEKVRTEAKAQSDADQIIRCGAETREETIEDQAGREIVVTIVTPKPNAKCEDRLNEQVLTSRYIAMLTVAAENGNTIYVVPESANTLLNLASGKAAVK